MAISDGFRLPGRSRGVKLLVDLFIITAVANGMAVGPETDAMPQGITELQGIPPTGPQPLSVAARCFLVLALMHFVMNAALYALETKAEALKNISDGQKARLQANPGYAKFEEIFSEKNLKASESGLAFVPVLSILMLFILFRAREQDIEVPANIQTFYYLATVGVVIQCLNSIVHLDVVVLGNVSAVFGSLFTYMGYGGIIYGLFTVRSPAKPLSTAAQAITMLSTLLFILQALVMVLEYKNELPSGLGELSAKTPSQFKGLTDRKKLSDAAEQLKEYVPLLCAMMFYLHFRVIFTGNEMPQMAELCMWLTTLGIYMQALGGVVIGGFNEDAGNWVRGIGMLVTYGGMAFLLYWGITIATIQSVPVESFLSLITVMCLLQILIVTAEKLSGKIGEKMNQYSGMMKSCLTTGRYASVICVLLLYCHFRSKMTGSAIPAYTDTFSRMAVWSIFLQIVIIISEGMLSDGTPESKPKWTDPCKMFFVFLLYIGFGGLVYSSFVIGVPPTAHNGIMALAAPPQSEMPGIAPMVQQATPTVLSPAMPKPAVVAPAAPAQQAIPEPPAPQQAPAEQEAKKAEQERKEAEKIVTDQQNKPTDTEAHQQVAAVAAEEKADNKASTVNLVSAQQKLQESANKEAATEEAVKPRKPTDQATLDAEVPALVSA